MFWTVGTHYRTARFRMSGTECPPQFFCVLQPREPKILVINHFAFITTVPNLPAAASRLFQANNAEYRTWLRRISQQFYRHYWYFENKMYGSSVCSVGRCSKMQNHFVRALYSCVLFNACGRRRLLSSIELKPWSLKFDVHTAVHRNFISIVKPTKCTGISNLFYFWMTLHISDGLSVRHQEFKTIHRATGICQTDTAVCLLAGTR